MNIGNQIKNFRLEKNVTQEEFAEFIGISPQAVSKWETGASTPDIALLPNIAEYFGITIDDLFAVPDEEQFERIKSMHWRLRRIPQDTFEKAVGFLNTRLACDPEDVRAYEGLAYLYNSRANSDHKDAILYAKKVMELSPERKAGIVAFLEAAKGACGDEWCDNHFSVIQYLKEYVKSHPKNSLALRSLVTNLLADSRCEEAVPYIHALREVKDGPNILIYLGDVEFCRGYREKARRLWDRAVEEYPDVWQAYCFRADRLRRIGLVEEAIADYEKCMEIQKVPHIVDGLYSLAQLHEAGEEYGAAIWDYEQIIECLEVEYHTKSGESVDSLKREIERLKSLMKKS